MPTKIYLPDHFHTVSGHRIYVLDGHYLQACADLDQRVSDALAPEEKLDFIPHDLAYYQNKTENGHKIVGAFDQGRLIAKANLTLRLQDSDYASMLERHLTPAQFDQYVMISGVATEPGYRGRNLQFDLVKARAALAREAGREYLMAAFTETAHVSRQNCVYMGMKPITDYEPSIIGGRLIRFYAGTVENALRYDPTDF